MDKGLHDIYCCGKFIAGVPADTTVLCPECKEWRYVPGESKDKLEGSQAEKRPA